MARPVTALRRDNGVVDRWIVMADTVETRCTIGPGGFLDNGVTIARNDAPVTSIRGRTVDQPYSARFGLDADRVALLFTRYRALTRRNGGPGHAIVGNVPGRAYPDRRHIPVGAANVDPHL